MTSSWCCRWRAAGWSSALTVPALEAMHRCGDQAVLLARVHLRRCRWPARPPAAARVQQHLLALERHRCSRWRIWYQAPWFCGSSWHQTISRAFGYCARPPRTPRPGTDTAARCARWPRLRTSFARRASSRSKYTLPLQNTTRRDPRRLERRRSRRCTQLERPSRQLRRAATPTACGAAGSSASSRSAACGAGAASAGAACGTSAPAWTARRPACCSRRTAAGSARGAPRNAPAPAPRSRAAGTAPGRRAAPLGLAGADELVDDHLGAVGEVAELAFPDHQAVGVGGRVAVLEAEHGLFRQQRVDDGERAAGPPSGSPAACSVAPVVLVVRTAWRWKNVPRPLSWPGQADRVALLEQAGVGQRLGKAPVEHASCPRPSAPVLDDLLHLADAG